MIELPKEDYLVREEFGRPITYSTLRQKVKHVIGLDYKKPYTRHGKKFYRPHRNRWCGQDDDLDELVRAGLMETGGINLDEECCYCFNRKGLDWLGNQLGIHIHGREDNEME